MLRPMMVEPSSASKAFSVVLGKDGIERGTSDIRQPDRTAFEAGVNAGFPNLADQLLVKRFVGIRFLLEGLVFEGPRIHLVEFSLGLRHVLAQKSFPIHRLLVIDAHPLHDPPPQNVDLPLQFAYLAGCLLVYGMG